MRLSQLLFLIFGLASPSFAQDQLSTSDLDFKLREGVYLSIQSFLSNQPDLQYGQIKNIDSAAIKEFDPIKKSYLRDSLGTLVPLNNRDIFGFSLKGTFYLRIEYEKESYFARSVTPGSLWQFAAIVTTYTQAMSFDPYYPSTYRTVPSKDLIQVVLNVDEGKVYSLQFPTIESFLRSDPAISALIDKTSKRKRKKMVFYFVRKYNERNPISF